MMVDVFNQALLLQHNTSINNRDRNYRHRLAYKDSQECSRVPNQQATHKLFVLAACLEPQNLSSRL